MSTKINLLSFAFLMLFPLANMKFVNADDGADSVIEPGARFAARIEALLRSLKQTDYQHTTEIDEAKGVVNCDCSGLVGFMLRQQFPEAYVSLKGNEAAWRKRPLAVTFYQTFMASGENANGSWQRVTRLMDASPGDILAWRKKHLEAGSTTGHVCIIAGKPEMVGDGKIRVRVIDSTRSPHEKDTRSEGKTGMGAGYKTFLVNADGECIGYRKAKRDVKLKIAVGRIVRSKASTSHAPDTAFVGLTIRKAIELAKQRELSWRIIREDGVPKSPNWLIKDDRLNFVIENGKVTVVLRG